MPQKHISGKVEAMSDSRLRLLFQLPVAESRLQP